jgi:hypothetical protein
MCSSVLGTYYAPNFPSKLVSLPGQSHSFASKLTAWLTALINYLATTYLPWRHEFAIHRVKQYRNYGIQSTSRIESPHRAVKRFLKNRLASLDQLYEVIRMTCGAQRADYVNRSARQRLHFAAKYSQVGLLQDLLFRISSKALELIWKQYRLAYAAWRQSPAGDAFAECKKEFTSQWGLPCKHMIRWLLQGGDNQGSEPQALSLTDVDRHWWLDRDGSDGLTAAQREQYGI